MILMTSARGFAPYIIVFAIAGVLIAGTVGYVTITALTQSKSISSVGQGLELSGKDQEAVAEFDSSLSRLRDVVAGKKPNYDFLSKYGQIEIQELRKQIITRAQHYLQMEPCTASLQNVMEALNLAGEAQQAAIDDGTDQKLIQWAKTAFRSIVSFEVVKTLQNYDEMGISVDEFIHIINLERRGESVDTFVSLSQLERTNLDRGVLRALAQILGYEDLSLDISTGKFIPTTCIQVFDVSANIRYAYDNYKAGVREKWMMRMTFKNVPFYRYGSSRQLPMYTIRRKTKAQIAQVDIANAAILGDWMGGKLVGDAVWKLGLSQENGENIFKDILNVDLSADLSTSSIHILFDNGDTGQLLADSLFRNVKMKIPLSDAFMRTTFHHEEKISKEGAEGIIGLDFVPIKFVTPNDVYNLLDIQ